MVNVLKGERGRDSAVLTVFHFRGNSRVMFTVQNWPHSRQDCNDIFVGIRPSPGPSVPPKDVIAAAESIGYICAMFRFVHFLLLLLGVNHWVAAQRLPAESDFVHYGTGEGLPDNRIREIVQDRQGFIWIATGAGLSCFDGNNFHNYFKSDDTLTGLPSNTIRQMLLMPDGKIALSTSNGLCLLDPVLRTFKNAPIPELPGWEFDTRAIGGLCLLPDGSLMAGCNAGFYVFDHDLNLVFSYNHFKDRELDQSQYQMGFAQGIIFLGEKGVFILGSNGIWKFDQSSKKVTEYTPNEKVREEKLFRLATASGKPNLTFFYDYYPDTLIATDWKSHKSGYTDVSNVSKEIHWLAKFDMVSSNILAFTRHTVGFQFALMDTVRLEFRFLPQILFGQIHVNDVFCDRQGRYWVSTNEGLYASSLLKSTFRFHQVTIPEYYEGFMDFTKAGDYLYGAAVGFGIVQFDRNYRITNTLRFPDENGFSSLWNIKHWGGDTLFAGSQEQLLCITFNPGRQPALHYTTMGFEGSPVTSQFRERSGKIWFTRRKSMMQFDPATKDLKAYGSLNLIPLPFPARQYWHCAQTDSGYVWMCRQGCIRWNPMEERFDRYFPYVPGTEKQEGFPVSIARDGGERILMAFYNNGLWLWEGNRQKAERIDFGNPDLNIIYTIQPDPRPHHFWLLLRSGIALVDIARKKYKIYQPQEGMPSNSEDGNFYYDTETDSIYLGMGYGVLSFYAKDWYFSEFKPVVYFTEVRQLSTGKLLDFSKPVTLRQIGNDLSIRLSSPVFDGGVLQYFYRIADSLWLPVAATGTLQLALLPHGEYVLEVKCRTSDGAESEISRLKIMVEPWFYQRWWFLLLLAFATATAVWGIFRWRLSQVKRMEKLRTDIAADLHDEVGASLAGSQILAQIARSDTDENRRHQALEQLQQQVKNTSGSLREIVWNVHPRNSDLQALTGELVRFAGEMLDNAQIDYQIEMDAFSENDKLPVDVRLHFTRIFKECITNIVRHSHATVVHISFAIKSNRFICKIGDNGKGFDLQQASSGNGLANIKRRTELCRGVLEMESANGAGTRITISLPMK